VSGARGQLGRVAPGLREPVVGQGVEPGVGRSQNPAYFAAAELVFGICVALYFVALLLVRLLPKHSQR
jgi:hypothetical protein